MSVALRSVASLVAPTTVLTALLFYYGRLHAQALTRQLRVQFTVFDFSFQDYVVRSADGLFIPVVVAALFGAVCLWARQVVDARLSATTRALVLRVVTPTAAVLGFGLLAGAVLATLDLAPFASIPEVGGLCLSLGVLSVTAAVTSSRAVATATRLGGGSRAAPGPAAVAQWMVVFLLVSAGLFWAVNSYATRVGQSRAQEIERRLPTEADAVLYSDRNLNLQEPGVRSTVCTAVVDPSGFRFRYEGLKLVLQSGGYYLFLPAGWNQVNGATLVIPRGNGIRLEFSAPGRGVRPPC